MLNRDYGIKTVYIHRTLYLHLHISQLRFVLQFVIACWPKTDVIKSLLSNNNYFSVCIVLFNHIIMFIFLHILFNKNSVDT